MDFKDYYEILGIPPEAEQKAVKSAYRKLARKYHPDVNPGNKEAEEKFKTINEAYQVLADAEQRKKYDELRAQYQRWQQSGGRPRDFNWQQWAAQPGEGVHVQYASEEDLEDLFGSNNPYSDFFSTIFGGARGQTTQTRTRPRKGQDFDTEVDVTLEEAYHGTSRILQMDGLRIEARIPPGVRTGSRIRLAGQGEPGRNGGPPGDLYLVVRLLPNEKFEREGDDLFTDLPVDVYTAVIGGEVRVPTLEREVLLSIPARTQAGRSFRLRGKGMPKLNDPNSHGDLYARIRLVLPDHLSDRELELFRELAVERQKVKE